MPSFAPAVGVTQTKEAIIMTKLPPDPGNRNDVRAKWAENALNVFRRETGVDFEDSLPDLLCDLMRERCGMVIV